MERTERERTVEPRVAGPRGGHQDAAHASCVAIAGAVAERRDGEDGAEVVQLNRKQRRAALHGSRRSSAAGQALRRVMGRGATFLRGRRAGT